MPSIMKRPISFSRILIAALPLTLFSLSPALASAHNLPQWLSPFSAKYNAQKSGIPLKGKATRHLQVSSDGTLLFETKASAFLSLIKEKSQFVMDAKSCTTKPSDYQYYRKVMGKKKNYNYTFDWQKNQAVYHHKDEQKTITLAQPTVADRLSEQLAVRCKIMEGQTKFDVSALHKSELKTNQYEVVGSETLNTKLGNLETLKVHKKHSNPKRRTTLWFSKKLDFLLVKLEQQDADEQYSLEIESYSPSFPK